MNVSRGGSAIRARRERSLGITIAWTHYDDVEVVGEMIRQNAFAHFLFRHAVEPVVLLPLFVRLGALLGLRELRSGRKREEGSMRQPGRDNTTLDSVFMPRHTIQRDACLQFTIKRDYSSCARSAERDFPRSLFTKSHGEFARHTHTYTSCMTQCCAFCVDQEVPQESRRENARINKREVRDPRVVRQERKKKKKKKRMTQDTEM